MTYICKRCGYESEYKHSLTRHLRSKNPCKVINDNINVEDLLEEITSKDYNNITYDCDYCNKKFNHKSSMYRHKNTCTRKESGDIRQLINRIDQLEESLKEKLNKIDNTTTNITHNTQNNINISVKLNEFGRENMDALPESLISSLFMNLRFRELLANLHCDPNYPENQNVRIKSIKRNTMEIYRNNKWDIMTFSKGLTELLLQGHRIFKEYYKKDKERILEEDMSEKEIKDLLDQLDQIERLNKEEMRPFLLELQMMLEEYKETGSAIVCL